jgi:hypothetical protein
MSSVVELSSRGLLIVLENGQKEREAWRIRADLRKHQCLISRLSSDNQRQDMKQMKVVIVIVIVAVQYIQ